MASFNISPSSLRGTLSIPPSKSQTLRALLFAAMGEGRSHILSPLPSPDTEAMIRAIVAFGARVERGPNELWVEGFGASPHPSSDVIDCGNSGLVLRLIGAFSALLPHYTILTGDPSIRHKRPAAPLLSALGQLGAFAVSSRGDGKAPLIIRGPLTRLKAHLDGSDSQPVSGLLIAASQAPHPIELTVENPGEIPWIDLTLSWLTRCGIPYTNDRYRRYQLQGGSQISPFTYRVPGDFSSAAFPLVAALLTRSELTLTSLDFDDPQGDKGLIPLLEQMGARLTLDRKMGTLTVHKGPLLRGATIDINPFIDALPILAVLATACEGPTLLYNGAIAREKESDRIGAIAQELSKMGARLEERPDGLLIYPSPLRGARLASHADHRIALSLAVASLAATSPSTVEGVECVAKTYSTFAGDLSSLGASLLEIPS